MMQPTTRWVPRMNNEIEALYSRIGQAVSDVVDGGFRKAYVRVEMADDYGSLGLFYDPLRHG